MSRVQSSRRTFLRNGAGAALAGALLPAWSPVAARPGSQFDPSFGSAGEALAALRSGAISSRELVAHTVQRIRKYNPKLNAFVTLLAEQASAQAAAADALRAKKGALGPLHGLPVLVKDSFATAGVRTTGGSKSLENNVPTQDAVVVARLKRAGAIILGKTNLPEWSGDWQTYNAVAGQTNNPWDLARTPGGSTGGGAAALAAGLGFLEVGSDIGGSIRIPSHFCGIYGHKPTLDLVPLRGHVPPGSEHAPSGPLSVAGPLARSAEDLLLYLSVLAGPVEEAAIAYRWQLPKPRRARLRDYKIGFVLDDPFCPVDTQVHEVLSQAVATLRKAGVQLVEGWPEGVQPAAAFETYNFLVGLSQAPSLSEARREQAFAWRRSGVSHPWVRGATSTAHEAYAENQLRLRYRALWQRYFQAHDAFLMPVNFIAAPPHDHEGEMLQRQLETSQGRRSYMDQPKWISPATLSGCPATAAPVGKTKAGLPVGIQIVGPYLEDATPIDIAIKMAELSLRFSPPPAFA